MGPPHPGCGSPLSHFKHLHVLFSFDLLLNNHSLYPFVCWPHVFRYSSVGHVTRLPCLPVSAFLTLCLPHHMPFFHVPFHNMYIFICMINMYILNLWMCLLITHLSSEKRRTHPSVCYSFALLPKFCISFRSSPFCSVVDSAHTHTHIVVAFAVPHIYNSLYITFSCLACGRLIFSCDTLPALCCFAPCHCRSICKHYLQ